MTRRERAVWLLAMLYAAAVTTVAGVLVLAGSLLGGVPGLPGRVERRYGATTMRALDAMFRPFDALPSVGPSDGE